MRTVDYRLSTRQRMYALVFAGLFALLGLLQLASGGSGLLGFTVAAIQLAYFFVFGRLGSTLTPEGIRVRGFLRRQFDWHEIADIDVTSVLATRVVRLRLTDGRKVCLRAPVTGFLQPDPHFDEKVHAIRQWWMAGRGTAPLQPT